MKVEAYVFEEEEKVLIVREDQPEDVINQIGEESDFSSDVLISADDPRLTEEVIEIKPLADAYALITTVAIC